MNTILRNTIVGVLLFIIVFFIGKKVFEKEISIIEGFVTEAESSLSPEILEELRFFEENGMLEPSFEGISIADYESNDQKKESIDVRANNDGGINGRFNEYDSKFRENLNNHEFTKKMIRYLFAFNYNISLVYIYLKRILEELTNNYIIKNHVALNKFIDDLDNHSIEEDNFEAFETGEYGYTGTSEEELRDFFYVADSYLTDGQNDVALSKYVNMYDLFVMDNIDIDNLNDLTGSESLTNFNTVLEKGIYDVNSKEIDAIIVYTDKNGNKMFKYVKLTDDLDTARTTSDGSTSAGPPSTTPRKTRADKYDELYNDLRKSNEMHYPKRKNNFDNVSFIDFGVKGKFNVYIKKYRFTTKYDSEFEAKKTEYQEINFLNKSISITNYDSDFIDNELRYITLVSKFKNNLYNDFSVKLDKMYGDDLIKTAYCKKLNKPRESQTMQIAAVNYSNNPTSPDQTHPAFERQKKHLINSGIKRNYIVQLVFELRNKIVEDGFMNYFNVKYFTYLFYSFNNGLKIFGNFINKVFDKANDTLLLKDVFFKKYNYEGLYKLFILSLKPDKFKLISEHDEEEYKMNEVFENLDNFDEFFNVKQLYFQEKQDFEKIAIGCSKIRDETLCTGSSKCEYDTQNQHCKLNSDLKPKCFELKESECGNSDECEFKNGKCSLKSCLLDPDGSGSDKCSDFKHCTYYERYERDQDGVIKDKCYDSERVMYSSHSDTTKEAANMPSSFFNTNTSHLNSCLEQIYDKEEHMHFGNAKMKCKDTIHNTCKFLEVNPRIHRSKYESCINNDFIDPSSINNCSELKTEEECDTMNYSENECFWQDGKCFKRDAPFEWRNSASADYGMEDMTSCRNFISEYECPSDRCVWNINECISKLDHPYFGTIAQNVPLDQEESEPTVPLNPEFIDCLSINNLSNKNVKDAEKECLHYNCHWHGDKNLCLNNIGGSCELHSTKDSCLDIPHNGINNFDKYLQQNKCKWASDDNKITPGSCIDNSMNKPCSFYSRDTCPLEDKVDVTGSRIIGSSYCKLSPDLQNCIDKDGFTDKFNHCHYNFIQENGLCNNDCKEVDLYRFMKDGRPDNYNTLNIQKCIPKSNLPCSALEKTECLNENIVGENCSFIEGTGGNPDRCAFNMTNQDIHKYLDDVNNPNNYTNIGDITKELQSMNYVTNENRKDLIRSLTPISGDLVLSDNKRYVENDIEGQFVITNSNRISKISIGDKLLIKTDKKIYDKLIAKNVNIINNSIYIEDLDKSNLDGKIIIESGSNPVWILNTPNLGVFGSHQMASAIIDSDKISNFYNNFV
jgi:hypothetical protein